jgi:hypothetical protein
MFLKGRLNFILKIPLLYCSYRYFEFHWILCIMFSLLVSANNKQWVFLAGQ